QELAAAVVHLVQDLAVPAGAVGRPQHEPVGLVLDQAAGVPRRALDVDDALVQGIGRVELASRRAPDALVRARGAERRTVRERLGLLDPHLDDARLRRFGGGERERDEEHASHGGYSIWTWCRAMMAAQRRTSASTKALKSSGDFDTDTGIDAL